MAYLFKWGDKKNKTLIAWKTCYKLFKFLEQAHSNIKGQSQICKKCLIVIEFYLKSLQISFCQLIGYENNENSENEPESLFTMSCHSSVYPSLNLSVSLLLWCYTTSHNLNN